MRGAVRAVEWAGGRTGFGERSSISRPVHNLMRRVYTLIPTSRKPQRDRAELVQQWMHYGCRWSWVVSSLVILKAKHSINKSPPVRDSTMQLTAWDGSVDIEIQSCGTFNFLKQFVTKCDRS
jgi:hypothetical protein